MIRFACEHCGKPYAVPDEVAGRRARCKQCGEKLQIPPAASAPGGTGRVKIAFEAPPQPVLAANPPAARKMPMRMRRLLADADHIREHFQSFRAIRLVSMEGNPPDKYRFEFNVRGLARGPDGNPAYRDHHLLEVQLTADYPRQSPRCRMLTPIFHPNFDPTIVCVGDHWTAGERLSHLVVRIGEMIAYQAYNIKSPLDGEAAMWADLNKATLPIDGQSMSPPGM